MCNCGKKRNEFISQTNSLNNNQRVHQPIYQQQHQPSPTQTNQTVPFQYTGNTALTITGSATRKNYRFNFSGDIQHVAVSDAVAMTAVPVLKRV